MNTEFFIARRIAFQGRKSFSKIIVRIAIVATALGLAVMICSMAIITGFNEKISEKIFGFWGHIHVTDIHITRAYEYIPIKYSKEDMETMSEIDGLEIPNAQSSLFDKILGKNKTKGGIDHIQSFAFMPGIIQSKSELEGIMLKGVNHDFDWDGLKKYLIEGEAIPWTDSIADRSIVISKRTSERLKVGLGDKLNVQFIQDRKSRKKSFKIGGIYKTGLEEYDVKFALCDIRIIQDLLGWEEDQIAGYEILLEDYRDMDLYADFIYSEILPSNQFSETIKDKFPSIFDWLDLQKVNEFIILFLMILVSIINMTIVVLIIILERSRMIGVLKAIGVTNWSIRKLFIYLAFWIIGFGLLLGNIIGLGFCWLQQRFEFIKLDEVNYYVSTAPIKIVPTQIILINILAIVVILIFMILPSHLVTRIMPAKVLRFD